MTYFVNLSNHPSNNWSSLQINKAKEYGKIIDIPFPNVSPMLSEEEIDHLADTYVDEVLKMGDVVVMCQGEFTLAYSITSKLLARNIKVVSACSTRKVKELYNKKVAYFDFVKFREYCM